jgi:hypothetical protein
MATFPVAFSTLASWRLGGSIHPLPKILAENIERECVGGSEAPFERF